jgi:hypothetical protein
VIEEGQDYLAPDVVQVELGDRSPLVLGGE